MPKISSAHRESRRSQILDAFRSAVARDGFHRTSMATVIAESGISTGGVYGHFKSKSELIHAVAQDVLGFATEQLTELAVRPEPATPAEIYRTLLRSALEVNGEQTPFIAVQVWAEIANDERLRAIASENLDRLRGVLTTLVERCQEAGSLPAGDASAMARAIMALLPGYVLQSVVYRDLTPEDFLDGAVALLG